LLVTHQKSDRKPDKDEKNTVVDTYRDKMPEGDNYYGLENVSNPKLSQY